MSSKSVRREKFYEPASKTAPERAILVGVHLAASGSGTGTWADLDELSRLAEAAGAVCVGRLEQRRERADARTFLGKGKLEQLKLLAHDVGATLILIDNELTPAQGRNIERSIDIRVLDRTELILDIFATHARTKQARLQVSLAQYEYLLPRLARMWKHLERQAGGIGTRGPGETQIETDRRIIRRRIGQLRRELRTIDRRMVTQTKQRRRSYRVAFVGYTNAGKSSLMNRLSDADVYVKDQLFATLDATTRKVETEGGHSFLLTDTVGFIRNLPHHLVESFRATLSEVNEADLLLHVVDASSEDPDGTIAAVRDVLRSVGAAEKPARFVFNKIDLLKDEDALERILVMFPGALFTSAVTGKGMEELRGEIDGRLRAEEREVILRLPATEAKSLALLYEVARVADVCYENGSAEVRLLVDGPNFGRLLRLAGVEILQTRRVRENE
ncbi:MAG TPA: GTPase HflX [Candidatus Krumholzibacteria bacterium]